MTSGAAPLAHQHFRINASIYDIAPEPLHQLLKAFLGELSFRSRLIGCQMFHDTPGLRLSVETMNDANHTYTLSAHYHADAAAVAVWVEDICTRLNEADILYLLDYFEEDADGNQLGEEVSIAHPEFDARYHPR